MPALLRDWNDEKTASIDWTDADEVLQHCKSLLHVTAHHPKLQNHCSHTLTKAQRFDTMKLFINMTPGGTAKKKQLLQDWNQQGLLQLRTSRWCRRCGFEGHTMKSCEDQGVEALRRESGQPSAKDRHREHLEELDRRRLAEERKTDTRKNRTFRPARVSELSDPCRGQVKAVNMEWQKAEILGDFGKIEFHFDRSEYGLKKIRVGDIVQFRVETYDERRMAVDVMPQQRELQMEDILIFTQQCNECSDTINQMRQTLVKKSDWRHLVNVISQNESQTVATVTAVIRLTTFRRNLEPINVNLLRAFLKLLLSSANSDGLAFFPHLVLKVCPREDTALLQLEETPNFVDTLLELCDFLQILRIHSKVTPQALTSVVNVLYPIVTMCQAAVAQLAIPTTPPPANAPNGGEGQKDVALVKKKLAVAMRLIVVAAKKNPLIPLVPTPAELSSPADLPASVLHSSQLPVATNKYVNSSDHVNAHAQLLRADTFHASSQIIAAACFQLPDYKPSKQTEGDVNATRQYDDVKMLGQAIWRGWDSPACYIIQVTPKAPRKLEDIFAFALARQCFVCITTGQDRTKIEEGEIFWGMVGDTDPHLRRQGIISITPISGAFEQLSKNLRRNQEAGCPEKSMLLETMVYYNGYQPVMQAMQEFQLPRSPPLPIQDALVHGRMNTSGVKYIPNNCRRIFQEMIDQTRRELTLDKGQDAAIRSLPSHNVVLVQGPPGTGKSFIGCRVVESYVKLSQKVASGEVMVELNPTEVALGGNPGGDEAASTSASSKTEAATPGKPALGPVVVITYKNHALDEFLLDLKRSGLWCHGRRAAEGESCACKGTYGRCCAKCCNHTAKLVRVGSGSQEPELAGLNLHAVMGNHMGSRREVAQSNGRVKTLQRRIEKICADVRELEAAKVSPDYFRQPSKWFTEEQLLTFNHGQLDSWLAGDNYVGKKEKCEVPTLASLLGSALKDALQFRLEPSALASATKPKAGDDSDDDGDLTVFQAMKKEANLNVEEDNSRPTMISRDTLALFTNPSCAPQLPEGVPTELKSLWSLSPTQRAQYLAYLIKKQLATFASEYLQRCSALETSLTLLSHARDHVRLEILQSCDVIGLTTTGCAMNQSLLRAVKPRMLVVEEAAEILESQLLACMTTSLEQVVLIGDHYQLQPKVETQELMRVNCLNVSMFERLANEMPPAVLVEQRRMVPQLSRLVRPYYDKKQQLIDHFSVNSRALIDSSGFKHINKCPGLTHPCFLWTHKQPEELATIGRSKINTLEVSMVEGLVRHLIRQRVKASSITVITPYLGQNRAINAVFRQSRVTSSVRVSTVDRFQGDENDVIILSLVRTAKMTTFLRLRNRLIVACSRARFGMVIIGNDELLAQSPHWKMLLTTLEKENLISPDLPIAVASGPPSVPTAGGSNGGTTAGLVEVAHTMSSADAMTLSNWPQ